MLCRAHTIIFLFLLLNGFNVSASDWDCAKDQNGEWVCGASPESETKSIAEPVQTLTDDVVKEQTDNAIEQSEASTQSTSAITEPEKAEVTTNEAIEKNVAPLSASEKIVMDTAPMAIPVIAPTETNIREQQEEGWDCSRNEDSDTWNCDLQGNDPKGQAKLMETGTGFRILPYAFDRSSEQTFKYLTTELNYDPWQSCSMRLGDKPEISVDKDLREQSPLDVGADYSEIFDNEIVNFTGNVFLKRADQEISANHANYDIRSQTLNLHSNVVYKDSGLSLFSESAQVEMATDKAVLRNAKFIYPVSPLRGSANAAYRESADLNHFKNVAYTSCQPGNQDWVMHASRLKLNDATGRGSVKHAWLELKSLPVFYLPYLSFPLDDRRQSGLLTPTFGITERSGVNLNVPYYWNIAPNYDAQFWLRYLSKRSALLGGKFRYLFEKTQGSVELEILPYDTERKETRWQGSIENHTVFTPRTKANMDLNYVSDEDYFDDLGNSLSFSNNRHLYSYADVSYRRKGVNFITKFDNYQTIDRTIADQNKPYRRLPQMILSFDHSFDFMPMELRLDNEFVYFQHKTIANGQRLNVKPSITFPFKTPGYYVKPKISGLFSQYWLQSPVDDRTDSVTRILPIASIDSGIFLERDFDLGDSEFRHTIEPRLFYLYIPYTNQDDIPLFDTSEYDFTFSQLFRENSFNGTDRIQDANQLTLALSSRLIDGSSGLQPVRFSIGNIMYFRDRKVQLFPTRAPQTESFSNLVFGLSGDISRNLKYQSGLQWNPERNDIDRGNISIRYRNQDNQIFNVGYRYRVDNLGRTLTINQSDVSFFLPIYNNWSLFGRWQYSILHNLTVESFIGLEKESCCWRFRILGRHFVNNITSSTQIEGNGETAFYFQFEFKGMTSVGNDVEKFLEQNLFGYRAPLY